MKEGQGDERIATERWESKPTSVLLQPFFFLNPGKQQIFPRYILRTARASNPAMHEPASGLQKMNRIHKKTHKYHSFGTAQTERGKKVGSRRIHLSQGLSQDAVRNGKCATIDNPWPQSHCKDLRPCAISILRLCCRTLSFSHLLVD